jgi:hypothetical protein
LRRSPFSDCRGSGPRDRGTAAVVVVVIVLVVAAVAVVGGLVATGQLKLSGSSTPATGSSKYAVTFMEAGLPTGTAWSVTLDGVHESGTTASIEFQEPSGKYAFVVGAVDGHPANVTSGNVTVSDQPVSVSVGWDLTPEELAMSVLASTGSSSTWQVTLGLSPTSGLTTAMFNLTVTDMGGTPQTAESPPTECAAYTSALSNCTGVAGGWYAALVDGRNGSVVATWGSAGWTYGTGVTSIALSSADTLVVVSATQYDGNSYTLAVSPTGLPPVTGSVVL